MSGPARGPRQGDGDRVAAAYDAIATAYDARIQEDEWMRRVLWDHYARLFRAGQRVLDLGCGTGLDTLFLAARGVRVAALDVSSGMMARLRERLEAAGLGGHVETALRDGRDLGAWPEASFDGAISAFAGLNALPELSGVASEVARVLRPGGRFVAHLLARDPLWPRLRRLARGRWAGAGTVGRRGEIRVEIEGHAVPHRLYRPAEVYASVFAPRFGLVSAYALGFLWPQGVGRRLPLGLAHRAGRLEARLGRRRPWLGWGRFFVLDLVRRPGPSEGAPA